MSAIDGFLMSMLLRRWWGWLIRKWHTFKQLEHVFPSFCALSPGQLSAGCAIRSFEDSQRTRDQLDAISSGFSDRYRIYFSSFCNRAVRPWYSLIQPCKQRTCLQKSHALGKRGRTFKTLFVSMMTESWKVLSHFIQFDMPCDLWLVRQIFQLH